VYFPAVDASCTDGTVRLFGGQSNAEGTVEICVGGVWGSVMTAGVHIWRM